VVTARATDKCSPAYLSANLTGQILDTVTITQYAVIGGKPEAQMIVTLTNALLAKYSISGSTAANPVESLSWAFQKICLNNVLNTTTACYNATTNQPSD
jgi:type VI protein secretion system component Hcp